MPSSRPLMPLCHADDSQLLIIDIQEKLVAAMPEDCMAQLTRNTERLVKAACTLGIPVMLTEQYPTGLGSTMENIVGCLPGDAGCCEKTTFSCCEADSFETQLHRAEERPQIILAGVEAHICVLQTAAGLQRWGFDLFIVEDATCSRDPANKRNALLRMDQHGIEVTNTESVVFEWLGDARHPEFKNLTSLFR